ncbi:MAG TPA: hypothetical protein PK014_08325 [Thermoanaerobaculia bacterium]|nr:hypothetical protein [Thermoanaerobaculia bacterium]HUM30166.1 hypothetical protein [Thermoanaerobaculia bacterium]HXK68385.1 hypothetical protein [Thermoanaerobaculia bacterium]
MKRRYLLYFFFLYLLIPFSLSAQESGGERFQPQLNPEISVLGDMLYLATDDGREEFNLRVMELGFQAPLDPQTRFKLFCHIHKEEEDGEPTNEYGFDIGEAYITYVGLPGHITLDAGKFRQPFGSLNRWHVHALPLIHELLPLQKFFGHHGLTQTGISLTSSFSTPLAHANELSLQVTNGENDIAFTGASFDKPSFLVHLKNYWDLSDAAYLEWGLSALRGANPDDQWMNYYGMDFTCLWEPPGREKYRNASVRFEIMEREGLDGNDSLGGSLILESRLSRRWIVGAAGQYAEEPTDNALSTTMLSGVLTFWQSPFVKLRAEYDWIDAPNDEQTNQVVFEVLFAAGPHKHETY